MWAFENGFISNKKSGLGNVQISIDQKLKKLTGKLITFIFVQLWIFEEVNWMKFCVKECFVFGGLTDYRTRRDRS